MTAPDSNALLEEHIGQWREYLRRRRAIRPADVEELEDHLRGQIATLRAAGLAVDEAFLVAIKRMGAQDAIANEFAREHSERLWKQLIVTDGVERGAASRRDAFLAFGLAVAAAVALKAPTLFGFDMNDEQDSLFYFRNASLFAFPFLALYFVWKRGIDSRTWKWLAAGFIAAAVAANLWPYAGEADTLVLQVMHMPLALWLLIGIAYAGGRWSEVGARMNFVRFSGELFIYYVLMALGGGLLTALTVALFEAIGVNAEVFVGQWLVPCGAAGAVLVGSWLVEAKQSVIENMAPVLTRLFTPLFTATLIVFLGAMVWTGGLDLDRDVLIVFDGLLALVLALFLYTISARDPAAPRGPFDFVLVVLLISALLADAVALAAIAARISEFGFTPNRVAGLGFNIVLLVNLVWSAWLYVEFVRGRRTFATVERWQTAYLPVYAAWAAAVVVVFPPVFGFA